MPRPLRLFTHITTEDAWEVVHTFGAPIVPTTATTSDLRVRSPTGPAQLFTACAGRLSVRPPGSVMLSPTFVPSAPLTALPGTCSLYLHLDPLLAPSFLLSFTNVVQYVLQTTFAGWLYRDLETASLQPSLGTLLSGLTLGGAGLTPAQAVLELLNGNLDVPVTAGHLLGAAAQPMAAAHREVGFAAVSSYGLTARWGSRR